MDLHYSNSFIGKLYKSWGQLESNLLVVGGVMLDDHSASLPRCRCAHCGLYIATFAKI